MRAPLNTLQGYLAHKKPKNIYARPPKGVSPFKTLRSEIGIISNPAPRKSGGRDSTVPADRHGRRHCVHHHRMDVRLHRGTLRGVGLGFGLPKLRFRGWIWGAQYLREEVYVSPRCLLEEMSPPTVTVGDTEREFFIDYQLVRIHLIMSEMFLVDRPRAMGV